MAWFSAGGGDDCIRPEHELVDEMIKDAASFSMKATTKDLNVMFCDMRGFTQMSEIMEAIQL